MPKIKHFTERTVKLHFKWQIVCLFVYLFVCLFAWLCLTPLSTILFQLYRGGKFIGGGNRKTRRKPLTCRK